MAHDGSTSGSPATRKARWGSRIKCSTSAVAHAEVSARACSATGCAPSTPHNAFASAWPYQTVNLVLAGAATLRN
eukprot:15440840-Alexandrium_andersonii.AAC.1